MESDRKLEVLLVELRRTNAVSQEFFDALAEPETKLLAKAFHIADETQPAVQPQTQAKHPKKPVAKPQESKPTSARNRKEYWDSREKTACPRCDKLVKNVGVHIYMAHGEGAYKAKGESKPASIPESTHETISVIENKGRDIPNSLGSGKTFICICGMEVLRSKARQHEQSEEHRQLLLKTGGKGSR